MSLQAHLAVQRNPFSTAVPSAKVCDGKASSSCSERINHSFQVSSMKDFCTIALIPSFSSPCQFVHSPRSVIVAPSTTPSVDEELVVKFNSEEMMFGFKRIDTTTVNAGGPSGRGSAQNIGSVLTDVDLLQAGEAFPPAAVESGLTTGSRKWILDRSAAAPDRARILSQGLRITPINNSESNNGWFEAIRVPSAYALDEMSIALITPVPADAAGFGAVTLDPKQWEDGLMDRFANWANCPGYISGKLRDIGKHMFYLQTQGDREFVKQPASFPLQTDDPVTTTTARVIGVAKGEMNTSTDDLGIFDTNFDTVLIRIHCLPVQTDTLATALHCHVVAHYECVFDSRSTFKKFETRTLANEDAVKAVDRSIRRDPKPSILRYGN
jgi:hypothetical protein